MASFINATRRSLSYIVPATAISITGGLAVSDSRKARCDAQAPDAELPALVRQAEDELKKKAKLRNPGSFDRIVDEGKRIANVDCFDGFRLDIQKMVTPQFIIGHSFLLGAQIPNMDASAIYDFSTQVVLPGNQMLVGRLGHGGAIDGRLHTAFGPNSVLKFAANMQPNAQKDSFSTELEVNGEDYNLTFKAVKLSQFSASYFQSLYPWLAVGVESLYDVTQGASLWNGGFKISKDDWNGVFMAANQGSIWLIQYVKHVNPGRMALVADLLLNPFTGDGQSILGMEVNMKQSRFVTAVDNDGKISALLESKVVPNAVALLLSAEIQHATNKYRFGYGFTLSL